MLTRVVRGRLYPLATARVVFGSTRPRYALPVKTNGRAVNLSRASKVDPARVEIIRRERAARSDGQRVA